jgi:hypothetical protein
MADSRGFFRRRFGRPSMPGTGMPETSSVTIVVAGGSGGGSAG